MAEQFYKHINKFIEVEEKNIYLIDYTKYSIHIFK